MAGIDPPIPYTWQVSDVGSAAMMNAQLHNGLTFLLDPPRFYGYQDNAQTIDNNAFVSVTIDSMFIDSESGHSNTLNPSRYVVKRAGWYEVTGSVCFTQNGTGFRGAKITNNGVTVIGSEQVTNAVSSFSTTVFCQQWVNASVNDYIELQAYQNSGAPLTTHTNTTMDYVTHLRLKWISI